MKSLTKLFCVMAMVVGASACSIEGSITGETGNITVDPSCLIFCDAE